MNWTRLSCHDFVDNQVRLSTLRQGNKTWEPAMSLGLNACHNRLRVPSSLDLSLEFDLMDPRQVKRERFSLGFRGGTLYSYPGGQATEPGNCYRGNMS